MSLDTCCGDDAAKDAGLFARELMAEVMIPSYFPLHAGRLPGEFLRDCCDGLSKPI